jgi:hypothetical protein
MKLGWKEKTKSILINIALVVLVGNVFFCGKYLYTKFFKPTQTVETAHSPELSREMLKQIKTTSSKTNIISYILLVKDNYDSTPVVLSSDSLVMDKKRMVDIMKTAKDTVVYAKEATPSKDRLLFMRVDSDQRYFLMVPRFSETDGEMSFSGLIKMSYYKNLTRKNYLSSLLYTNSNQKEMELCNTPITAYESGKIMYDVYVYYSEENFRTLLKQNHIYQLVTEREVKLPNGQMIKIGNEINSEKLEYYRNIYKDILNKPQKQVGDLFVTVIPRIYINQTEQGLNFEFNGTYNNPYFEQLNSEIQMGIPPVAKKK